MVQTRRRKRNEPSPEISKATAAEEVKKRRVKFVMSTEQSSATVVEENLMDVGENARTEENEKTTENETVEYETAEDNETSEEENETVEGEKETTAENMTAGEKKSEEEEIEGEGKESSEQEKEDNEGEEEGANAADEEVRNGADDRRKSASDDELRASELEAIKPSRMFFPPSQYRKLIKIGTRCFIADAITTLDKLNPKLSNFERKWFEEHPQFKHLFHFAEIEKNHKVQGMWMLLLRTAKTNKEKEVWFIVNGVSIRYGLREHTLISGLNCDNYPVNYKKVGGVKFVDRHFKAGEPRRLEDVKAKLVNMGPHKDKLKMAVLFFLGSVIRARTKVGKGAKNVFDFIQRAVDDLEFCKTFPWGRYSHEYMLEQITHTMKYFNGVIPDDRNTLWPIPGFCVPLEILDFEAIPKLGKVFREPVHGADKNCPVMCKWTFKSNGLRRLSLSDINDELGHKTDIHTVIPTKTSEEVSLLNVLTELEDDVDKVDLAADSWERLLFENLPIFFKDMFDEDVAAREKETDPREDMAEARDGGERAAQTDGVMKTLKSIVKMMKGVDKKVDDLGKKVDNLEVLVKAAEKKK